MQDWLVEVLNIPWVGVLVGVALFLIGLPITYIFYLKSKTTTRLSYAIYHNEVIAPKAAETSNLEVRYKGVVVPRVTNTTIGIWNSGTTTILGTSIVAADPLRASILSDGIILDAVARNPSRPVIAPVISADKFQQALNIDFDFLDEGDGFLVAIAHSGELHAVGMDGTIRGLPKGIVRHKSRTPTLKAAFGYATIVVAVLSASQLAFMKIAYSANMSDLARELLNVGVFIIIALVAAIAPSWLWKRRLSKIPAAVSRVVDAQGLTAAEDYRPIFLFRFP